MISTGRNYHDVVKLPRLEFDKMVEMIRPFVCHAMQYKLSLINHSMSEIDEWNEGFFFIK
jgi:hypothetical protein